MTPFSNPHGPVGWGGSDVVHAWAVVPPDVPALLLLQLLEGQLQQCANRAGAALLSAPAYETFELADPGVPTQVLLNIQPAPLPGVPVVLVHAYALTVRRNAGRPGRAASQPVAAVNGDAPPS